MRSLKKLFTPFMLLGLLFTSCGKTTPAPEPPVVTYTCEEVVKDIAKSIFDVEEAVVDEHYWDNGDGSFGTGVSFGADYASEEYLPLAVSTVAAVLPEYCESLGEAFADTWSDGSAGYFQVFEVSGGVIVQLGSYVTSVLGCQIDVYPIPAEE